MAARGRRLPEDASQAPAAAADEPSWAVSEPAAPWPATEIIEGIWQSGSPQPGEPWDAVVDLDGGGSPLEDVGFYVVWRIVDGPPPEHSLLVAMADLVRDLRRGGKRILIHCAGGMNRSGLVVAAALVRDGMPAEEAIDLIRRRRPGALNNRAFVEHLLDRVAGSQRA